MAEIATQGHFQLLLQGIYIIVPMFVLYMYIYMASVKSCEPVYSGQIDFMNGENLIQDDRHNQMNQMSWCHYLFYWINHF